MQGIFGAPRKLNPEELMESKPYDALFDTIDDVMNQLPIKGH